MYPWTKGAKMQIDLGGNASRSGKTLLPRKTQGKEKGIILNTL
jgi:hypothetical protein